MKGVKRERPLVLLVDDEVMFLEIVSTKLAMDGFETVLTYTVQEAIEKAEALIPDLVLSDIFMPPGPSGWELALALRRNPKTHDVKVAFFTSLRDPLNEIKGNRTAIIAELGATALLSKTDDVDVLGKKIAEILNS